MSGNTAIYALGALALGIVGLVFGDFARQWQPVTDAVPFRTGLAYACAALLAAGGLALLVPRRARQAAAFLAVFYALWVVLLHVPVVLAQPVDVSKWLGLAEILALTAAGTTAWCLSAPASAGCMGVRTGARLVFGGCLMVFGLSHFVYAEFTAGMVPDWIPFPLFWAYATGCGHVAAGLSLLTMVLARLAAMLLTAMCACFVVLLHVPRVAADPGSHLEWVMVAVATSITGAALIMSRSMPHRRSGSLHGIGTSVSSGREAPLGPSGH